MNETPLNSHYPMGSRFGNHPYDGKYPGRLIVVEGIDGSGKSTQIDLLSKWLTSLGYVTVFTEWNSSPIVRRTTKRGKDLRLLTPMSFSLIHAADFANRVYTQILPGLQSGTVALADRYVYTAFARDAARGVNTDWLRRLYAFAVKPSLALYFKVPLEESIRRIVAGREEIGYYESGQDLGLDSNRTRAFRAFQGRLLSQYEQLTDEYGLVTVDATKTISEQQKLIREYVKPLLPGLLQVHGHSLPEALSSAGLTGRYIHRPGSRSGRGADGEPLPDG